MAVAPRVKCLLAMTAATTLLGAACSGVDNEESAPETLAMADEPVVIEWLVGLGTGSQESQVDAQEDVVRAFNESQDRIVLDVEMVDSRIAFEVLTNRIESGDAPDIVGPVGIRGSDFFEGQFLDLSEFLANDVLDDYDPQQVEVWVEDGRLEALPFGVFPSMIFYNRDLFDRAGLAYPPTEFGGTYEGEPWDVDALTRLSRTLTLDAGGRNADDPDFDEDRTVQWGFAHQWIDDARSHGSFFGPGTLVADDGTAQIPDNWRAEWQWYYDGIWTSQTIPSQSETGSEVLQGGNMFASGRLAMAFTHLWYTGSLIDGDGEAVDFWDLAATPSYDGVVTSKLHADTFRVMASTEHPDEAVEVLEYLHGEGAAELLQTYGSFPARVDLRQDFFSGLSERYPQVENWTVVGTALQYPDLPSHESGVPSFEASQEILDTFSNELKNDPDLDLDARIEQLEADLDQLFAEAG